MKQIYPLLALLFLLSLNIQAQKVAICGFNTDDADGFSFLALTNLTAGSAIFFTDGPYVAATNSFTIGGNNAVITYIVPAGGLPEGQVIRVVENGAPDQNTFTLTRTDGGATGSVSLSGGIFQFQAGEPVFAFSATTSVNPEENLSELFGYVLMGGATSGLGDDPAADGDCPRSPGFVAIQHTSTSTDGASFDYNAGTGVRDGIVLADFTNVANWTTSTTNLALSTAEFTNLGFGGLPVEWLGFKAIAVNASVKIFWVTAMELNNDYFAVENSLDGVNFVEIGKVKGAGNSDAPQSYEFTDTNPLGNNLFYRVRQVDFDGATSYTSIVNVNLNGKTSPIKLYPNPVVENLYIEQFYGVMTLFNIAGQQLKRTDVEGFASINMADWEKGVYIVKLVNSNGTMETYKIVK
ncbi:MAG: T9SS type A sorting domain-containing protein [Bacteroidia bacterium]|nr:T9SS type A sorting domain-containing protein [Bacteroidia bacterium]